MKQIKIKSRMIALLATVLMSSSFSFAQTATSKHIVERGETLETIAEKYGVSKDDLVKLNPDAAQFVYVGMELVVPEKGKAQESTNIQSNQVTNDNNILTLQNEVETSSTEEEKESIATYGINAWLYDETENYGLSAGFYNSDGWSGEFNIRTKFERYSNYNIDLAFMGYSVGLLHKDDVNLYASFVCGPSLRMQTILEYNEKDNKTKDKDKFFVDAYVACNVALKYKGLILKAGYYIWGAEFKFSKGYKADGFYFGVGYKI